MKRFPVHRNISKTPTLFGLPMQAGGLFFGISILNAIASIFLPANPLLKLGCMAVIPIIIYIGMLLFFSRYSFDSFYKRFNSRHIVAIKNKSLAVFKNDSKD